MAAAATAQSQSALYRHDGVRITHDPFAPEMAEKYGTPGQTDSEGFDPYADSVGAGIYGGIVKRDPVTLAVLIGRQYQNHNPHPGPVYAGGGYTPVNSLLHPAGASKLEAFLEKFPELVNDISTGGAQPLHMCGMSQRNQDAVATLVSYGADIEAVDTYGFTPLKRMASNNLARGALALLEAGASWDFGPGGSTPLQVAREGEARDVIEVLQKWSKRSETAAGLLNMQKLVVSNAGVQEVNGEYEAVSVEEVKRIPKGFSQVCIDNRMGDPVQVWKQLAPGPLWFSNLETGAYIFWNSSDKKWWIDAADGLGVYIVPGPRHAPPAHGWELIREAPSKDAAAVLPMVRTFRSGS